MARKITKKWSWPPRVCSVNAAHCTTLGSYATRLSEFLHILWIFVNNSIRSWFSFGWMCACGIEWRSMNRERPPSLAAIQPASIPAQGRAFRLLMTETNIGVVLRPYRSKLNIKLQICLLHLHEVLTSLQSDRRQILRFKNMLKGVEFIWGLT